MSEYLPANTAEFDQEERNMALLRNSELGVVLEDAYIDAMNVDPRISEIAVVPITDPAEKRPAFARPAWETGRHEIHIRLDNLDDTLGIYKDVMQKSPGTVQEIAKTLDIQPTEVTPQLLFAQSILHEMGHTLEFFDYQEQGKTSEDHARDSKIEAAKRPLGGLVASRLLDPNSKQYQAIVNNWDAVSRKEGVNSPEELFDKTAVAHRHTKFEHDADRFAATVLQMQPGMMTQLTGNIDRYRNYPQSRRAA
jgi:hypothetical protein